MNPKFEILPNESLAQAGSSSTGLAVRSFDMVTSPALKTLNRKLNLKPSISKPQLSRMSAEHADPACTAWDHQLENNLCQTRKGGGRILKITDTFPGCTYTLSGSYDLGFATSMLLEKGSSIGFVLWVPWYRRFSINSSLYLGTNMLANSKPEMI